MFSSGMSAGALAVLALFAGDAAASHQIKARQFGNATTSSVTSSPSGIAPAAGSKLTVAGRLWQYDGCLQSESAFSSFSLVSTSASNTVESCLAACPASRFAGLNGESCYCSNVLDEVSTLGSAVCDISCPGNGLEACGGVFVASKRQLSNLITLSLYEAVVGVAIVPVATPAPFPAAGEITFITYVNNYFDVCDCDAGLIEYSTTTTLSYSHCGCTESAPPAPPMTTTTKVCNNCGPNGSPATVTLTLPCTATTTGSAVYYNGTCAGKGCPVIPTGVACVTPVCVGTGCPAVATSPAKNVITTTVTVNNCAATAPVVYAPAASPAASCKGNCPVAPVASVPAAPAACNGNCPAAPAASVPAAAPAACNGNCPAAPAASVPAAAPAACNGNCPGAASPTAAVATKACPTCPGGAKYTGAASAQKVGGILMAAGLAAALL